jgi:acetyl-CoA carboxylase biotin carboxyl carrier protein
MPRGIPKSGFDFGIPTCGLPKSKPDFGSRNHSSEVSNVPSDATPTPKASTPRPFDVKTVEHLIGLMAEHDLSEISLVEGEQRIKLRKGGAPVAFSAPVAYAPGSPVPPPAAAPAAPPTPAAAPAAAPKSSLLEIKSPMVGTFYAKPSPDKPDYVSVGSKVTPATVVCKLEAMKIFNDIAAEISGTIAEVCVKNAQPVDYGTVLFRVTPG